MAVVDALVTWGACYGMPSVITTDRGIQQFTSVTWGEGCAQYSMQHITTMAFHPQAKGIVETGEAAPPDEGRPLCQGWRCRLGRPPAVGDAGQWHPSQPQGGVWGPLQGKRHSGTYRRLQGSCMPTSGLPEMKKQPIKKKHYLKKIITKVYII